MPARTARRPGCAIGLSGAVLAFGCLSAAGAPVRAQPFRWGVNGHPHVQEGYRQISVARQLDLVAQLGAGWYRNDWDQARWEKDPAAFDSLVAEAARRGLRILPVIFPSVSCRSDATPERIRRASFEFAKSIATRFRGRVSHWELDNEVDNLTMVRKGETCRTGIVWQWGDPGGDRPEHYEETRYQKAKSELIGLHEGIKAGDPSARTIVDCAGWLHYGFMERLVREDRVPFDILGWHWYSEMGDMTRVRGRFDLVAHLRGYGKPIWITEINRRGGSVGGKASAQASYLRDAARQVRGMADVEAFFAYELLDEPYFGADNPESHYGLVETVRGLDGRWRVGGQKPAYHALAAVIVDDARPASRPAASRPVRFGELPEAVRHRARLPASRPATHAAANPFGTQTTSMVEGHESRRLAAYLKDVADAGFAWVKDYLAAGNVAEGEDWRAKWSTFPPHYETFLRTANSLGLRVMLRLDYPRWRGGEPTSPEALQAVARFYHQVVRRYKPWVKDWEIDNEPNIGNAKPRIPPADYAAIVKVASRAIRAEDPEAKVYGPASAMLQCLHDDPFPYIPRLLDAGLLDDVDVFSFHPYRQPYQRANVPEHASEFYPWQVWGSYRRQIDDLRTRLRAKAGRDVPIAATEVGYPTHIDRKTGVRQISLATQAKYEQRMMIADFALGVRPRVQFIFKRPWSDSHELEHQFNLVNPDNSRRPAYYAVRNVCAVFDDALEPTTVCVACDAPPKTNPQLHVFVRECSAFCELLVALWAGVPADDARYQVGACRLMIGSSRFRSPVLLDLMQPAPVEPAELPYEVGSDCVVVRDVPLHDSPVVVRLFAQRGPGTTRPTTRNR